MVRVLIEQLKDIDTSFIVHGYIHTVASSRYAKESNCNQLQYIQTSCYRNENHNQNKQRRNQQNNQTQPKNNTQIQYHS